MFHSARALLYYNEFREKSHFYLLVALRALYVEKGLMSEKLLSEFHDAMVLRENADYNSQFSKSGANAVIKTAKEILALAKSLLRNNKSL